MYRHVPEAATRMIHDPTCTLKILRHLRLYGIAGKTNTQETSHVVS